MSDMSGTVHLAPDTRFRGQIRGARRVEIAGDANGGIVAGRLVVLEGGLFDGRVSVEEAEVYGTLRGEIVVRQHLQIGPTGDVEGNVRYGQLSMVAGGNLVAELRNVPPELAGDFELIVERGGQVVVTHEDLLATDADDDAADLTFTITAPRNGRVARAEAPGQAIVQFTQADIDAGRIVFVHDGGPSDVASFDVVVADDDGATAGAPRPVMVRIR